MKKYLLGKKFLKFINLIESNIKKWPNITQLNESLSNISKNLKKGETLYLKSLINELFPVLILDLGKRKIPIYEEWLEPFHETYPLLREQLKCLGATINEKGEFGKATKLYVEIETDWQIEDLKKSKQDHEIIDKVKSIIGQMKETYQIYRTNIKDKKLVGVQNE